MRRLCMVLLAAVLIPYVMTLAWTGGIGGIGGMALGWQKADRESDAAGRESGRSIILDEHGGEYMDMETYLIGVTARQIPAEYEPEAIKAQAIIARTYLWRTLGEEGEIRESELEAPFCEEDQMEFAWGSENYLENYEKIKQAVSETYGMVLKEGEPLFHPVSAGFTRDGGEAYPHLKSVESPDDLEADNYVTVKEWSPEEFVKRLEQEVVLEEHQALKNLQLVEKDESGYVKEYQIGSHIFSGRLLSRLLELPSEAFSLSVWEGKIRAICKGIGHGYGLSQYGAHRMALEGKTAEEILGYYYHNVSIISMGE